MDGPAFEFLQGQKYVSIWKKNVQIGS